MMIYNFAYYPVLFKDEASLLRMVKALNEQTIYPRRYFYPSLSSLDYVRKQSTPIADDLAQRVLCLPLYHTLSFEEVEIIARCMLRVQRYG